MQAYCMECKKKVEVNDGEITISKKGRKMVKGKCAECGTTVCKILKAEEV